jgi:hypothetical protein
MGFKIRCPVLKSVYLAGRVLIARKKFCLIMYTREEAARIRRAFWTALGQYLAPIPPAGGGPVNWINYKTGVKDLFFRMDAGREEAFTGIVLAQPDTGRQALYYDRFESLRSFLHDTLGEEWTWQPLTRDESGRTLSRIFTTLPGVDVLRQEDWPRLISFFKPRIVALDEFWSVAGETFRSLE